MEELYSKNFDELSNFELIEFFNQIVEDGRMNGIPIQRTEELDYMLSDKTPLEIMDFAKTNDWIDVNSDYFMADNYGRLFSFNENEIKKVLKDENYMDYMEEIFNEKYELKKYEEVECDSSIPKKKKMKDNDMER